MLRISTAQRTKARSFGRLSNISAWPFRQTVGDDDVDIARRADQAGRIQRIGAFVQHDLRRRLQPAQAALAIILLPCLRRMSQQNPGHQAVSFNRR